MHLTLKNEAVVSRVSAEPMDHAARS